MTACNLKKNAIKVCTFAYLGSEKKIRMKTKPKMVICFVWKIQYMMNRKRTQTYEENVKNG